MILTGPEIEKQADEGRILISPWEHGHSLGRAGPNSLDLKLDSDMVVYRRGWNIHRYGRVLGGVLNWFEPPMDMHADNPARHLTIPEEGLVLQPGVLYLGRTIETVGTDHYVPMVEGRSSVGRLGMEVHITAGFCDTGFKGSITLEISVVHPLRVYAGERICQVYFTRPEGKIRLYEGRYQGQTDPTASRMHLQKW